MKWHAILNLKPKAEKFEERMTVKIIIERIIKALSLLTQSNVFEKVKIFEIIESIKPRGNTGNPFGLNRFFSCMNIPDKFLA